MHNIKQKLQSVLRNKDGVMASRDRFKDIQSLVKTETPLILECGASVGPMIALYLELFENPHIYAFEPQPQFVEIIKEKFSNNDKVEVFQNAVGNKNEKLKFNVLNRPTASSFMAPTVMNKKYHNEQVDVKKVIEVEQVRLDDVIKEKEVDFMKLDLQGYEIEALKGAERLIKNIKVITTEIEFIEEYKGQPLFGDIDVYLRSKGFYLYNLYELFTQSDGQLTAGDAIYLNKKYFEEK